MDDLDRRLLDLLQTDFPIAATPYAELAEGLKISEDEILRRTEDLVAGELVRRFGAAADSRKLGFVSTLVGARVDQSKLADAVDAINAFAEVTHNYEREEDLNIWFTVIARNELRKEQILAEIQAVDGVEELLDLPATHVFKIRVQFKMSDEAEGSREVEAGTQPRPPVPATKITEKDLALLRNMRDNFPVCHRPFAEIAEQVGLTEQAVIERMRQLKASGHLRKIGVFLRHRRAGYKANGMVVWQVAEDQVETIGERLAREPRVTHAYARPASKRWPYRLYTMLHSQSRRDVIDEADRIAAEIGVDSYRVVFSSRELKKSTPPLR